MRRSRTMWLLLCLLLPATVWAHAVGTSYVDVAARADGSDLDLQVQIHLRDVEFAVGIDRDGDGALTWGELVASQPQLVGYIARGLRIERDGQGCTLELGDLLANDLADGPYATLRGRAICGASGTTVVHSDLMFAIDAQHRTLFRYADGHAPVVTVLTADGRDWRGSESSIGEQLKRFVGQGMHHIWTGFDHLAFLFILLLPALLADPHAPKRRDRPVPRVLWIVSAFTVAHSITLALSVLGLVKLPERPVEVAIALSVILAALGNLHPRTRDLGPVTAFAFGLLHGFGFAAALGGLSLDQGSIGIALAGFNLGVEAGQLIVVAAVMPVLHLMRGTHFYVMKLVPAGSVAVAGLGALWLVQRLAL